MSYVKTGGLQLTLLNLMLKTSHNMSHNMTVCVSKLSKLPRAEDWPVGIGVSRFRQNITQTLHYE